MFIRKNGGGRISTLGRGMVIGENRYYYNGGENIVRRGIAPKGKEIYCGKGYGK